MKFSERSKSKLATCHYELITIMEAAIETSEIDFGISEGHRTVERQKELFDDGKSKIDGITKKGKHNYEPALACDIYAYIGKVSWDDKHLIYLGGHIKGVAALLKLQGKITHDLRWGGNWDRDGVIISDQTFIDLPHFELK